MTIPPGETFPLPNRFKQAGFSLKNRLFPILSLNTGHLKTGDLNPTTKTGYQYPA